MKTYKFRGKDINGNYVYGLLIKKVTKNNGKIGWAIATGSMTKLSEFVNVNENSVAQLIGYDGDGKEVYEGDILVNDSGSEFQASLKGIIISLKNPCYCRYLENLKHRKYYRLKGAD